MNPSIWKYVSHPAVLALVAAILTFLVMRMDCSTNQKQRCVSSYCKNIAWVSGLVGGVAYLLTHFAATETIDLSLEGLAIEPDF